MEWRRMPPLAALRAFSAFVETGGVREAGAALNVSHAAISQQLRGLEDHLGLSLLDRTGRALTLTAEGAVLAEALRTGFGAIDRAVAELTQAEAARPLTVTTTTSFASTWLMPRYPAFRMAHPDIDLVIAPGPEIRDPAPGGIDLAIRYGLGTWPGLDAAFLMSAPVIGVGSPALVGRDPPRDAATLATFPWIQELGTHEASGWLARQGVADMRQGGLLTVPGNLMLDAARAGHGIAVTTKVAAMCDIDAGLLVVLFEEDSDKGYYLVTHPGTQRPALRKFVTWLRREAKTAAG